MHVTVLGSQGFIGSRLAAALADVGHRVESPPRNAPLGSGRLGHVIYAIGVTADFRTRPFDTVESHVCRLNELLRDARFDSLTYLSSTRVYQGLAGGGRPPLGEETAALAVDPHRADDLYNLSKLMGESLCLHAGRPAKVVRLANVYGPLDASDNFLPSVIRAAVNEGEVTLRGAPESAKDYVSLEDVAEMLPRLAVEGRHRVYNLASGHNVSHAALAERLAAIAPCRVRYVVGAAAAAFPLVSIERLREEFDFRPASLLDDLPALVECARRAREVAAC